MSCNSKYKFMRCEEKEVREIVCRQEENAKVSDIEVGDRVILVGRGD